MGPVWKEVKVQFLENQSSAKEITVTESRPSSHCAADPTITAAAATAAAIAATAPLLKVGSMPCIRNRIVILVGGLY